MSTGTGITAEALRARLAERLAPSALEVLDESSAHLGHAGQDGTGAGTHFRVRIASPLFAGKSKVAIELALALGGEVVNADAMQMYDGLNVATAKARLGSLLLPARLC